MRVDHVRQRRLFRGLKYEIASWRNFYFYLLVKLKKLRLVSRLFVDLE